MNTESRFDSERVQDAVAAAGNFIPAKAGNPTVNVRGATEKEDGMRKHHSNVIELGR